MTNYLWINPVSAALYEGDTLDLAVREKGFLSVQCQENHIEIVREKYRKAIARSSGCVVDMRCPMAAQYIKEKFDQPKLIFPDIHPILIHCARELQKRYTEDGAVLTVTTPCASLKLLGESLGLPGTVFLTWNEFVKEYKIALERKSLENSPIPPGFFDDFERDVHTLASYQEFDAFFMEQKHRDIKLVEALYCEAGCHNGDGILEEVAAE